MAAPMGSVGVIRPRGATAGARDRGGVLTALFALRVADDSEVPGPAPSPVISVGASGGEDVGAAAGALVGAGAEVGAGAISGLNGAVGVGSFKWSCACGGASAT